MKKVISVVAALSAAASAYALPNQLINTVTVRDFSILPSTPTYNPNFQKPGLISGHETGIVDTTLPPSKIPGFAGPGTSTGPSSVTTAADFAQWWSPTVDGAPNNAPFSIDLVFDLIDSQAVTGGLLGTYSFDSSTLPGGKFLPIDGAGSGGGVPSQATGGYYGNEGQGNNFGFTLQYNSSFQYVPGAALSLDYFGDDDLWVFVNNQLVLDLGGVHPPISGSFVLSAASTDVDGNLLNLTPGQWYDFDFYYAERHTPNSQLQLQYTVFQADPIPEAKAMVPSLALVAGMTLMAIRRRRMAAA